MEASEVAPKEIAEGTISAGEVASLLLRQLGHMCVVRDEALDAAVEHGDWRGVPPADVVRDIAVAYASVVGVLAAAPDPLGPPLKGVAELFRPTAPDPESVSKSVREQLVAGGYGEEIVDDAANAVVAALAGPVKS